MSEKKNRIIVVGATSAIAEHCARWWVAQGPCDVVLVGRDAAKTDMVAADLRVRSAASVVRAVHQASFEDPAQIAALADQLLRDQAVDTVLIAHGSLPDQALCEQNLTASHGALTINGISPVLFAEAFVAHMVRHGGGTLGIIGSVAGDRGRKSNYVYGAAKGLVTRYAQGLQHRLAGTPVKVVLIKPGPTATPMTAHLAQQGAKLASVEAVAQSICRGMAQGKPVVYAPTKWAIIMMIIRHLPRFVFNRLDI